MMAVPVSNSFAGNFSIKQRIEIERPNVFAGRTYFLIKRLFDIAFSFLGLIVLLVPMLLITVIVMIDSPGSPIFRQERLGKDGKPFMILKFRSMRMDAEANGPQWAEEDDPRCTRLGRYLRKSKLDELPQLLNIFLGDMSFVGPRPERAYYYEKFEQYIHGFSYRLLVVPGLTGYAQVNGGYNLAPEEKIIYDIEYIEKQSVWFDLSCIIKTIGLLFTHKGAR